MAEAMKRTYPLKILGRPISVQSGSGEEHVETVADLVAERMTEIRDRARSADAVDVAILAALNLADDYLRARHQLSEERARVRDWAESMCKRVDEHV